MTYGDEKRLTGILLLSLLGKKNKGQMILNWITLYE